MKNTQILTAVCVPEMKPADTGFNTEQIIRMIQENAECGLMVFPELCVTGYTCADLFNSNVLIKEAEKETVRIAQAVPSEMTAVVGVPVLYHNSLYNCAAVLSAKEIKALIPKSYIPVYSEFYEGRWFTSGRNIYGASVTYGGKDVPFGTDIILEDRNSGAKAACEICEDVWTADTPSAHACLAGAEIICNLSASDELIGKQEYRRTMITQKSASCYCAYLYASSGVHESSTDLVFSGHAMIAENGRLLKDSIYTVENSCEKALIDLETIRYNRMHQNTFETEGESLYRFIETEISPAGGKTEVTASEASALMKKYERRIVRNPFIPSDMEERGRRCRTILQIQAHGLAQRVRATGIRNLVIGISGGLDSTLALLVCSEARKIVKDIRIIAYTMPSEGNTSSRTYSNAISLMECLQAEVREVPIRKGVESHLQDLGRSIEYQGEGDVTYENAQARMRTYILMDAANMENGLVVGTGDLSELALGWCTYNGDHMSMYAVNASVPKTLVKYICTSYADTCGDEKLKEVLYSIAETSITPELTPAINGQIAQKTEEKIGKYDLNDFFLYYHLRWGFSPAKILAHAMCAYDELDIETIREAEKRFFRRFFTQQFKRSCLPDGPKVGSVTLSPRGDWRMPSDASSALWLKDLENA